MHPDRLFPQMQMQEGLHLLQTSIASGQVEIAGTIPINIYAALSTQLQGNPIREPKVEKKGGRTPVRVKTSSADSQVRAPGQFQLIEIQNRTKEVIHTLEIFPKIPMEEILQPHPNTGMGGKTIRYLETWKLVKGVEFIQKGFFLLFKNEDSEKRLQERLRICPFSGLREEETAYTEKLEEELRENIIEQIHPEQAKWFNPTFIIPKPHWKWRKIIDASSLNKEIQMIHFIMNGTDQVRDLIRKGDRTTSLELKSAFQHLIVYPSHRPYLAFEAMEKVYQYRVTPFREQHSPIIFAQALAMVLTKIRRESDIRILNYVDDLLPLQQNKERLRENTQTIICILEAFGCTLAQEQCETEPKQQINFLGQTSELKSIQIKMIDLRKQELHFLLKGFIKLTERQVTVKIMYLASIIGKLNLRRIQVREDYLYLMLMDSAKTRALKNKKWRENMILPKQMLQELHWWQRVIMKNQEMTLEMRIPEAVIVSYASPKGC
ncbi:MAG: putative Transposon Ty3-G Gag-Pol polyprotein [Streblomastix strix]|uniref:Putative Transposon Ty3-G Gag-Pol polyprotein n=1 Tax=Streblomastix strix TaxID=222440 RepID=A0A5J4UBR9_9EUKA|nr:MAG: putative Transposon Ty3-G Gag-Pol polyprotein [Streblomastix strix]